MALNATMLGTEMLAALLAAAPITDPASFCNVLAGVLVDHIKNNAEVVPGALPTGLNVTVPPAGPVVVIGVGTIV